MYDSSYSNIAPKLGTSKHKIERKLKFLLLHSSAIQKSVSKKNWENSSTGKKLAAFCSNHVVRVLQINIGSGIHVCAICIWSHATIKRSWTLFSYRERSLPTVLVQNQNTVKNRSAAKSDIWLSTAHWKLCSSHRSKVRKDRAFLTATPQSQDKSVFLMSG